MLFIEWSWFLETFMNYFTVLSTSGLQDQLSSLRTSAEVIGKKVKWHKRQSQKSNGVQSPCSGKNILCIFIIFISVFPLTDSHWTIIMHLYWSRFALIFLISNLVNKYNCWVLTEAMTSSVTNETADCDQYFKISSNLFFFFFFKSPALWKCIDW